MDINIFISDIKNIDYFLKSILKDKIKYCEKISQIFKSKSIRSKMNCFNKKMKNLKKYLI